MTAAPPTSLDPRLQGRLPALDGLRGLAILGVMLLHMSVLKPGNAFDAPFFFLFDQAGVGVDLFFVLSGFLITGILLDEQRGRGYLRDFYARRALRIFPLYFAMLVVAFGLLRFIPIPVVQKIINTDVSPWPYFTFTSNLAIASSGRFRNPVLDITWSLSIEEQFYLFWPLLVYVVRPRTLIAICVSLIVGSLITRTTAAYLGAVPVRVYLPTWNRVDGLAIGALVAVIGRLPGGIDTLRRLLRFAGPTCLLAAVTISTLLPSFDPRHAGYAVRHGPVQLFYVIAFAAMLVSVVADPTTRFARAISVRPFRVLGKYSYALYLINLPLRAAFRDVVLPYLEVPVVAGSVLPRQLLFYALVMPLCVAAAWLSWHAFEKHFLKLKKHFERSDRDIRTDAALD